ncbi:unnamed protein product, partial [Ectocarpus sp. 12 AP-2014]
PSLGLPCRVPGRQAVDPLSSKVILPSASRHRRRKPAGPRGPRSCLSFQTTTSTTTNRNDARRRGERNTRGRMAISETTLNVMFLISRGCMRIIHRNVCRECSMHILPWECNGSVVFGPEVFLVHPRRGGAKGVRDGERKMPPVVAETGPLPFLWMSAAGGNIKG